MTQVIETWHYTYAELPLDEYIREVGLPVHTIVPTAWRTTDSRQVLVSALIVFLKA